MDEVQRRKITSLSHISLSEPYRYNIFSLTVQNIFLFLFHMNVHAVQKYVNVYSASCLRFYHSLPVKRDTETVPNLRHRKL
jgi:hypothetical protein